MGNEAESNNKRDHFDQMMFGRIAKQETLDEKENNQEIDFFETAQLVADTYQKLSPYTKAIQNIWK